jgi:adenine-specific DNA-methyltransferase
MARGKKGAKREIANYVHTGREQLNNPPVGLVTADTDKDAGKTTRPV